MRLIRYQAVLSPTTASQVQAAQREIERVGGRVAFSPPNQVGLVIVLLELPESARPDQLLPGLPFYPA